MFIRCNKPSFCLFPSGLAGPFWFAASRFALFPLFAMISFEFRTKAPGAKTFLQVINLYRVIYEQIIVKMQITK